MAKELKDPNWAIKTAIVVTVLTLIFWIFT